MDIVIESVLLIKAMDNGATGLLKRSIIKLIYYNKMCRLTGRLFYRFREDYLKSHTLKIKFVKPNYKKSVTNCITSRPDLAYQLNRNVHKYQKVNVV
jgi:hypothetical protein